jgi:DNA-binding LacI/PurR family transcriptional regulator
MARQIKRNGHRKSIRKMTTARLLVSQNMHPTIGLLISDIHDPNHQRVYWGADDAAREQNANLLYFVGGRLRWPYGFEAQGNVVYDLANTASIDGLVIWGLLGALASQEERVAFCRRYEPLPIVSMDVALTGIHSVLKNDYQAMRDALTHLIEVHGYRRIVFVRGPQDHPVAQDRYRAYTDALAGYGCPSMPAS